MVEAIAVVFPGQGSQYVGMGLELARTHPEAKKLFLLADEILGEEISPLCFQGPIEELSRTIHAQPAIFVIDYVCWSLLAEQGLFPQVVAGHSLGEYTALAAAGVLEFGEALRLVKRRAELMQKAAEENPGKMIAVLGLEVERVVKVVESLKSDGVIAIANYNCPGQVVISGELKTIDKSSKLFEKVGAKRVVELPVSGGFHSPLMESAEREFRKYLEGASFRRANFPVISNYTARPSTAADEIKCALEKQITGSVLWQQSIERMLERVKIFVEVGPGRVLSGLIKRIASEGKLLNVEDAASFRRTLEELQKGGLEVGWSRR